jgi:hypothetical protein
MAKTNTPKREHKSRKRSPDHDNEETNIMTEEETKELTDEISDYFNKEAVDNEQGGISAMAVNELKESRAEHNDRLYGARSGVSEARNFVAWYIDNGQKLANQAVDLQERATEWAKDTPLANIFEWQYSLARKFIEGSADLARAVWQVEGEKA